MANLDGGAQAIAQEEDLSDMEDGGGAPARQSLSDLEFRRQLTLVIPHLKAFGRSLSGNRDLADDLVQDTLMKAWAARKRFEAGTNIRAWTFIILRNLYFSQMRRARFKGEWDDLVADRLLSKPDDQQDSIHLNNVRDIMRYLPVPQQEALFLVGECQLAYEEAAEIVEVAIGTIKSRVARGRVALELFYNDADELRKEKAKNPNPRSMFDDPDCIKHLKKMEEVDFQIRRRLVDGPVASSLADLDIDDTKESIRQHALATGKMPTSIDGKIEYGPYAGQLSWGTLSAYFGNDARSEHTFKGLKQQVADELKKSHGLDFGQQEIHADAEPEEETPEERAAERKWRREQLRGSAPSQGTTARRGRRPGSRNSPRGRSWSNLEVGKIKQSIRAHYESTGAWPTVKGVQIAHGPYAGTITWVSIQNNLKNGTRGLPKGSSLRELTEQVQQDMGWTPPVKEGRQKKGRPAQQTLSIENIEACILETFRQKGRWPTQTDGRVKFGPYADLISWKTIDSALAKGERGLAGGLTVAKLRQRVQESIGWQRPAKRIKESASQPDLEIGAIKESILAHYEATGEWPKNTSGKIQHGPYAGTITWGSMDGNLHVGRRGLPGGSTVAALKAEVQKEIGWIAPTKPRKQTESKRPKLEIGKIKECILAHHQQTSGKWPTVIGGKVKYGPYANQTTWNSLNRNLKEGTRGLDGDSSLKDLVAQVQTEIGWVRPQKEKKGATSRWSDLDVNKIKKCLREHYQATGEWPTQTSGTVEYGPYAGQFTWPSLDNKLANGTRGLPKSSLAKLKREIRAEDGWVEQPAAASKTVDAGTQPRDRRRKWVTGDEPLEIEKIKMCILAHYQTTGAWPTGRSGPVAYGPYADGNFTWSGLENNLINGGCGLKRRTSISKLKKEIKAELKEALENAGEEIGQVTPAQEQKPIQKQQSAPGGSTRKTSPLEIEKIKECMIAHYEATGEWPSTGTEGFIEYGPYKDEIKWKSLPVYFSLGKRGLPKGYTFGEVKAQAQREVLGENAPVRLRKWFLDAAQMARQIGCDVSECERLFENFARQARDNGVITLGTPDLKITFQLGADAEQDMPTISNADAPKIREFLAERDPVKAAAIGFEFEPAGAS